MRSGEDDTIAGIVSGAPARAAELAGQAYERAGDAVERAVETTSEAYDRARDAARRSVSAAAEGTRGLTRFMREEPMVLAGLGIALGALVGALLPATEIENRTMGEASDALEARRQGGRARAMGARQAPRRGRLGRGQGSRPPHLGRRQGRSAEELGRHQARCRGRRPRRRHHRARRRSLVPSEEDETKSRRRAATRTRALVLRHVRRCTPRHARALCRASTPSNQAAIDVAMPTDPSMTRRAMPLSLRGRHARAARLSGLRSPRGGEVRDAAVRRRPFRRLGEEGAHFLQRVGVEILSSSATSSTSHQVVR